jgi:hypothetical protein
VVLVGTQEHRVAILFVVGIVADGTGQHKAFPHREKVFHSYLQMTISIRINQEK